jgi:hypothetical protein
MWSRALRNASQFVSWAKQGHREMFEARLGVSPWHLGFEETELNSLVTAAAA